jgi:hypothetical protein
MEHEAARTAIAAVLGAVQERWGVHSLTRGYTGTRGSGALASRAGRAAAAPSLPPWWPNAPGYLRPNILELSGPASCGKLGIALLWLAAASRGGLVAVVDGEGSFYPPAAAASGLDLARLVVVRPPDRRGAAEAVSLLVSSAGFDAVLWPVAWKERPKGLDSVRLSTLAARAQTTLLALVTDHRRVTAEGEGKQAALPSADARLRVTGWEWIWRDGELAGVRPRVRTERLRGSMPGQEWELQLEQHGPADLADAPGGLVAESAAGDEARRCWPPPRHQQHRCCRLDWHSPRGRQEPTLRRRRLPAGGPSVSGCRASARRWRHACGRTRWGGRWQCSTRRAACARCSNRLTRAQGMGMGMGCWVIRVRHHRPPAPLTQHPAPPQGCR